MRDEYDNAASVRTHCDPDGNVTGLEVTLAPDKTWIAPEILTGSQFVRTVVSIGDVSYRLVGWDGLRRAFTAERVSE